MGGWPWMAVVGDEMVDEDGGSGRREMNPTSTVDAVDNELKLRSHPQ